MENNNSLSSSFFAYFTCFITSILAKFHARMNKAFFCLGKCVAEHKGYFIVIPLFITAICATGFQRVYYEDDPEYLFAPSTGAARGERAVMEENFSMNHSSLFEPTRMTRTGRFARFIITSKDEGTILRQSIWNDITELDNMVKEVVVKQDDKMYNYKDVCAIKDNMCLKNNVLQLASVIAQVENGTFNIHYPINLEPFLLPHFYGGIQTNEEGTILLSAKAIQLYYWIRNNSEVENYRGKLWEKEILKMMELKSFDLIKVARFTSTTLEDELEKNTNSVKPFVSITLIIMTFFSFIVCSMEDWVRGKPILGIIGVATALLSSFAAFGFLIYIGIPFIGINMAAPFLMLGIGLDDTFVLLAAWRRTLIQHPVPQRLAETYSEAAVSITITSLTDMISFLIGMMTPFPSVQIFCLYTGTAVCVTYLWHITLFGGCLAVAGFSEKAQRHSLLCIRVKSKSEAEKENCVYSAFCGGGINKNDPWNLKDNRDHVLMTFFKDYVGRILNIPPIKAFVICMFIMYLGGAIFGCLRVQEGLEKRRLSRYDSYSVEFYDLEDKYFRVFPYNVQVVISGNVTYSNPDTKSEILKLMKNFEDQSYISADYTQSVIRYWYSFLEENAEWLDFNITDEKSFIKQLREVYVSDPSDVLNLDIKYNDDYSRILATRFILQTYILCDSNSDKNMMEGLRDIAKRSKFNVTVFNPFFIFFDQFVLVRSLSIQAITLAAVVMMLVSFIFIPNAWCSMCVGFSIISIEIGVVGYMTMWGVNLDSISMINLIMCIGFSVDFSAHISYAYLTAKADTPDQRVRECLFSLGLPIVQGGLSTILGVVALIFAPSYIFVTFFKIVFLVIFFGIMHGIFLLPVLLSIIGPRSFKKRKDLNPYDEEKMIGRNCKLTLSLTRESSKTGRQTGNSQPDEIFSLHSRAFVAADIANSSDKCSDNYEKDMGIGTSGEDSSDGSLQEVEGCYKTQASVEDVRLKNKQSYRVSYSIKRFYNNSGYVSDELEENTFSHTYQKNLYHPPRTIKHNQSRVYPSYSKALIHHRNAFRNHGSLKLRASSTKQQQF